MGFINIKKKKNMKKLFSLGELYPSDFLASGEEPRCIPLELKFLMDDSGAVRLDKTAPKDKMWGKYWYRSGINFTMRNELKGIVESINSLVKLKENDLWIDIASNDGTLLSNLPTSLTRVGVDPADDTFKVEAERHANLIIQDYFSAKIFKESKYGSLKAKVVTTIAMFYDLEEPDQFIQDVAEVMDDNGLWVLQLSYTPLMIKQMAFDNLMHEHFYYYSLFNMKSLFEKNGFKIVDCQLNDINGGSFRVYAMKQTSNEKAFGTQPYRDVAAFRVESLLEYEKSLKLDCIDTWLNFHNDINILKEQVVSFIREAKAQGKTVAGYGASSKGNTLLQVFGLDYTLIDFIAERSSAKWGLRTVGTNIPIVSEQAMRARHPDYLLALPWHFINEFRQRESEYLAKGGCFLVPCPKFEIIRLND